MRTRRTKKDGSSYWQYIYEPDAYKHGGTHWYYIWEYRPRNKNLWHSTNRRGYMTYYAKRHAIDAGRRELFFRNLVDADTTTWENPTYYETYFPTGLRWDTVSYHSDTDMASDYPNWQQVDIPEPTEWEKDGWVPTGEKLWLCEACRDVVTTKMERNNTRMRNNLIKQIEALKEGKEVHTWLQRYLRKNHQRA